MNNKLKLIYDNLMLGISKSLKESLYDFNTNDTLQQVYENIGYDILRNNTLNESLSDVFNKLKGKAKTYINAAKNLTNKMSDSAKNALENIKQKAGKAWDKVKDTIISVIAIIDNALRNSKTFNISIAKTFKMTEEKVDQLISTGYYNILLSDLPIVPQIIDYIVHIPKTTQQVIVMNMLLIAIPIINKSFDFDLDAIQDLIKTIKFTKSNGAGGEVSASMDHI